MAARKRTRTSTTDAEGRRLVREVRRRGGSVPAEELFGREAVAFMNERSAESERRARLLDTGLTVALVGGSLLGLYLLLRPRRAPATPPQQLLQAPPATGLMVDRFGRVFQYAVSAR